MQQIGQRELRRAPILVKRTAEIKKKELELLKRAGTKAQL